MKAGSALVFTVLLAGCAGSQPPGQRVHPMLQSVVSHAAWEAHPPQGFEADGARRNLAPGDSMALNTIVLHLEEMRPSGSADVPDTVLVSVRADSESYALVLAEGSAVNRDGYRISVLSVHTDADELGAGKTEFEIGVLSGIPNSVANSTIAGGPQQRLRIPHQIRMLTLHHSGSAEPLRIEDDVPEKIRELQLWSESDRNWWDVPYHFLIGLDGTVYEGRDYRYRGETNTRYDVDGHLLISVLGNYEIQDSTPEQVEAITTLMAWAVDQFGISLDQIYGHSDLAETSCPGKNLRKYLDDGTFRDGIATRLAGLPAR